MTSLEDYIQRTSDPDKKLRLASQWKDAVNEGVIKCVCGLRRDLTHAYKCLYCGEWYCAPCAEVHFGQTIQDWIFEKRVEKRREFEVKRTADSQGGTDADGQGRARTD